MKKILFLALLLISGSTFAQTDSLHTKARFGAKGSILYKHDFSFPFANHEFSPPAIAVTRTGYHAWQEVELSYLTLASYFGSVNNSDIGIRLQYNYYILSQAKIKPYVGFGVTARRTFQNSEFRVPAYYTNLRMEYSALAAVGMHVNFGRKFLDLSLPMELTSFYSIREKYSSGGPVARRNFSRAEPFDALYIRAGFGIWF